MRSRIILLVGVAVVILGIFSLVNSCSRRKLSESSGVDVAKSAQELHVLAKALLEDGDIVEAKNLYKQIVFDFPNFKHIDEVRQKLEILNMKIIFSIVSAGELTVMHEVQSGDTLSKIAKKYSTTVELIKRSNGLKTDVIQAGRKLRIWTGVFSMAVDKSQNKLTLKSNDEIIKVYDVATGAENCTPVGTFTIKSRIPNPVWYKDGEAIPPESPENILGTRWLGFDLASYGIHGTTQPESIGQQTTQGCVRMLNKDVEELYSIVPLETEVVIVD